jgi:hypothetical protein
MKPLAACSVGMALAIVAVGLVGCASPRLGVEWSDLAGSDRCATCHEQEARFSRYGAHRTVECERCHGPGAEHARDANGSRHRMSLGDVDLCLSCHKQGPGPSADVVSTIGSFEDHLRKLERDHSVKLDRQKAGADCVYCHDPHLLE